MAKLAGVMASGRLVAYQPTSLRVIDGLSTRADPVSIRADLAVLRPRFDGLVTYGAIHGAEQIPGIAASLGFKAVIIGVYDPFDPSQMAAALATARAHPDIVVGLSLGNEMVFDKRRSVGELANLIAGVRQQVPAVAVSTTEPFHVLYDPASAALLAQLDFLLANVHPVFQPWFRTAPDSNAAQFVVNVVAKLAEGYCGPILVKEVGVPTAPAEAGYSEERQASFFRELQLTFRPTSLRSFAYFSAFDAPWRAYDRVSSPAEGHWGLYDEGRRPKPVVAVIPLLRSVN
jgi:glucan 1,3-beta-glucosidase